MRPNRRIRRTSWNQKRINYRDTVSPAYEQILSPAYEQILSPAPQPSVPSLINVPRTTLRHDSTQMSISISGISYLSGSCAWRRFNNPYNRLRVNMILRCRGGRKVSTPDSTQKMQPVPISWYGRSDIWLKRTVTSQVQFRTTVN